MENEIIANDETIRDIVKSEIKRLGNEADLNHIDVSQVTNMWGLFDDTDFNGDISQWDVSNVKYMGWMFQNSQFNGDVSNWDVSNATSMSGMFKHSQFNQDINMWNYNFKAVEKKPYNFILRTKERYTLIEKYVNALEDKKFDLAEKIKIKMKGAIKNRRNKHDNTNQKEHPPFHKTQICTKDLQQRKAF